MGYFRECPGCGAHLDPGERCDCGIKGDGQYRQYPDAPIATRRGCENNTEVNDYEEKKMPMQPDTQMLKRTRLLRSQPAKHWAHLSRIW